MEATRQYNFGVSNRVWGTYDMGGGGGLGRMWSGWLHQIISNVQYRRNNFTAFFYCIFSKFNFIVLFKIISENVSFPKWYLFHLIHHYNYFCKPTQLFLLQTKTAVDNRL